MRALLSAIATCALYVAALPCLVADDVLQFGAQAIGHYLFRVHHS